MYIQGKMLTGPEEEEEAFRKRIFTLLAHFEVSHVSYVTLSRGRKYEDVNVCFNDTHRQGFF
jgi:hypothetical protein